MPHPNASNPINPANIAGSFLVLWSRSSRVRREVSSDGHPVKGWTSAPLTLRGGSARFLLWRSFRSGLFLLVRGYSRNVAFRPSKAGYASTSAVNCKLSVSQFFGQRQCTLFGEIANWSSADDGIPLDELFQPRRTQPRRWSVLLLSWSLLI
jgi:hypothetical protein